MSVNAFGGDLPTKKVDHEKLDKAAKEERVVQDQWRSYTRARDAGHTQYVEEARKYDDYYVGDQWDDTVKNTLESQKRPAHTVNLVLSTVNAVVGEYISTRQDISFSPVGKGASAETANSLRFLFKQIESNNKSRHKEKNVFEDGLIQDRGYFYYYLDFSDNIQGEVREIVLDPTDVIPDPGAKEYDPATWSEVFITRWMTPDEIGALYGPEFKDKLDTIDSVGSFGHDSIEWEAPTFAGTHRDSNSFEPATDDIQKVRRVRVIERQHKKLARTAYFVDPEVGDMRRVPEGWSQDRAQAFAINMGLTIMWKPERRVRATVTADRILLHDRWSLFNELAVVPFFPYFRRGRPFGLVRNLISPQDMLNKVTSQELHVVNTTANSGWVFESGSLVNMDAYDLEQRGAKTGLILEFAKGSAPPVKIPPNQIPTGLDQIANKAGLFFREISGVNEAMLGQATADSSRALDSRRRGGLIQQEIIFEHLALTRQLRAEFILDMVQSYYNETRMIQVLEKNEDGDDVRTEVAVNQPYEAIDEETGQAIEQILNDLTLGEYCVDITTVPRAETYEETVFDQLVTMREQGVPVPNYVIVEHSQLPNKREVAEIIKKQEGLAAPTEEEIAFQTQLQELQMRQLAAEVAELEAHAMERQAHAMEMQAKAQVAVQQPQLDQVKFGAELRRDMTKMTLEHQANREDLAARLAIMDKKSESAERMNAVDSMTKRTQSALDRMSKLEQALLSAREARERSRSSDNNPPKKA